MPINISSSLLSVNTAANIALASHNNSLWNHSDAGENTEWTAAPAWLDVMLQAGGFNYRERGQFGQEIGWTFPPAANSTNSVEQPITLMGPIADTATWADIQSGADAAGNGLDVLFNTDNFTHGYGNPLDDKPSQDQNASITSGGSPFVDRIHGHIATYEANITGVKRYWIFGGLLKMDSTAFGAGYPLSGAGLTTWKETSKGPWRTWQTELSTMLQAANPTLDIGHIDGQLFVDVWDSVPGLSSMTVSDWFYDEAPHGKLDVYAVHAAIAYSTMFGSQAPDISASLVTAGANAAVSSNWTDITAYIHGAINQKSMGMNLIDAVETRAPRFIDKAKQARQWQVSALNADLAVDSSGNITSQPSGDNIAALALYVSMPTGWGNSYSGTYRITWEGTATLTTSGGTNLNILTSNSADVDLTFEGTGTLLFECTNPSDLVRNVTCVRHEDLTAHAAGTTIDPIFLAEYQNHVHVARFMNWMVTNKRNDLSPGEFTGTFAEWTQESDQRWKRVPFSVMVELCNTGKINPWFCIPHAAPDAFVTGMAEYVRDNLDTDLVARFEYSNEIWNSGTFLQDDWVVSQAQADWGDSSLNARLSWASKRMYECIQLINTAFAGQTSRVKYVAGGAITNDNVLTQALTAPIWQTNEPGSYVNPITFFDEIGVNPYFGFSVLADNEAAITSALSTSAAAGAAEIETHVATLITATQASITSRGSHVDSLNTTYGSSVSLAVYEYNQHIDWSSNVINGYSGSYSTDLADALALVTEGSVVQDGLDDIRDTLKSSGATILCYFLDTDEYSSFGQWGANEYYGQEREQLLRLKAWHSANFRWW